MSEEIANETVVVQPTKKPKKKKSMARKVFEWVFVGAFAAVAAFVIAGNIQGEINKKNNYGQSIRFGMGSFIVLTDSMEPDIPVDSAIITYQTDISEVYLNYTKGITQDVTFANVVNTATYDNFEPDICDIWRAEGLDPTPVYMNRVMTHRIIEMHVNEEIRYGYGKYYFVAAGINDKGIAANKGQYQIFTEKEYLGVVKISNQFLGKVFNFIVSTWGLLILLLIPAAYLIIVSSIDIYTAMKETEAEENTGSYTGEGKLASVSQKDRERLKRELLEEMKNKRKEKENDKQD